MNKTDFDQVHHLHPLPRIYLFLLNAFFLLFMFFFYFYIHGVLPYSTDMCNVAEPSTGTGVDYQWLHSK